ncbi:hypothetical protein HK100_007945, partial [Physocladia obscura]
MQVGSQNPLTINTTTRERRVAQNRISQKIYRERQAARLKQLEAQAAFCRENHATATTVLSQQNQQPLSKLERTELVELRRKVCLLETQLAAMSQPANTASVTAVAEANPPIPFMTDNTARKQQQQVTNLPTLIDPLFELSYLTHLPSFPSLELPVLDLGGPSPTQQMPLEQNQLDLNFWNNNCELDNLFPAKYSPSLPTVAILKSIALPEYKKWDENCALFAATPPEIRHGMGRWLLKKIPSLSSPSGEQLVDVLCDCLE